MAEIERKNKQKYLFKIPKPIAHCKILVKQNCERSLQDTYEIKQRNAWIFKPTGQLPSSCAATTQNSTAKIDWNTD